MVGASGDAEAHRQLYVAAPRKVRRGWIKVHRGVAARSTQRTGAQRMSYTLAAAAAACGLNKSTVLRAIKAGKISGTKARTASGTSRPPSSIASTRPLQPRRRATVRCHGTQCRRNTCGSGKQRASCQWSHSLPCYWQPKAAPQYGASDSYSAARFTSGQREAFSAMR